MLGFAKTGSTGHFLSCMRLQEREIDLLGKMQRFRDQSEAICELVNDLLGVDEKEVKRSVETGYSKPPNSSNGHATSEQNTASSQQNAGLRPPPPRPKVRPPPRLSPQPLPTPPRSSPPRRRVGGEGIGRRGR